VTEGQGVLGSVLVPWQEISGESYFHVDFSTVPIPVEAGTLLAVVLRPQWMSFGLYGSTKNPYPFGGMHGRVEGSAATCVPGETRPCGWSNEQAFDVGFLTYVTLEDAAAPVPEPATLTMVGLGVIASAFSARRAKS